MLQLLAIYCDILRFRCQAKEVLTAVLNIQGSAKRWALGCVIPASWVPLAAEREFTQPRVHLLADPYASLPSERGVPLAQGDALK